MELEKKSIYISNGAGVYPMFDIPEDKRNGFFFVNTLNDLYTLSTERK